jgi:hypothetical protein
MSEILISVSPGEVLDKITILRIKSARIGDATKLANVRRELELLERTWAASPYAGHDVQADTEALQAVNARLWDIEDRIRDKERVRRFDAEFVELARAVYLENDARAAIKRRLNLALGSAIVEEKSYASYR